MSAFWISPNISQITFELSLVYNNINVYFIRANGCVLEPEAHRVKYLFWSTHDIGLCNLTGSNRCSYSLAFFLNEFIILWLLSYCYIYCPKLKDFYVYPDMTFLPFESSEKSAPENSLNYLQNAVCAISAPHVWKKKLLKWRFLNVSLFC